MKLTLKKNTQKKYHLQTSLKRVTLVPLFHFFFIIYRVPSCQETNKIHTLPPKPSGSLNMTYRGALEERTISYTERIVYVLHE